MPRKTLAVGEHGEISYMTLGRRRVRAKCRVRDADGEVRHATAVGTSNTDARDKLRAALKRRPGFTGSDLTADSGFVEAADAWIVDIDKKVTLGDLAANTARNYRGVLDTHVKPALKAYRLRECTTHRLDAVVTTMRAQHGAALTRTARTVLNGVMSFAVRADALQTNPMREVSRVKSDRRRKKPRSLSELEREKWLRNVEADEVAVARDIPDITRFLLATGCRMGECLAVTFDEVDIDAKTVEIDYTVVRIKGVGLVRTPTKTAAGERTLRLPGWAVDMLMRRGDEVGWRGPVFPIPAQRRGGQRWKGGVWRDPSNTSRDFRQARDDAGFSWVTSHVFRKTVATVMEEAGMTPREIADQLGHAKPSMTQDVYLGRAIVSEGAVALERVFRVEDPQGSDGVVPPGD